MLRSRSRHLRASPTPVHLSSPPVGGKSQHAAILGAARAERARGRSPVLQPLGCPELVFRSPLQTCSYFLSSTIAFVRRRPPARHPSTHARARRPPAFALMHALASPSFNCPAQLPKFPHRPSPGPGETYKATVNRKFMVDLDANGHYGDPKDGCASDEISVQITGITGDVCTPRGHTCPTDAGRRDGDAGVRLKVRRASSTASSSARRRRTRPTARTTRAAPRPARPSRASASAYDDR